MVKIIRSDVDREEAVRPLVSALKVPKLSDACRILFVNGDALALSMEFGQIGLVSLQGSAQGNLEGAEFLIAESQGQLITIVQQVLPQLIQRFAAPIVSTGTEIASIQDGKQRESAFTVKIVETIKTEMEKQGYLKALTPYIGGAFKPFIEMLVGSLYKFYFERHKGQRQLVAELDDVLASLKRLGLLSPFLGLAICPACNNFESVFSRFVRVAAECLKCGSPWPVLTVSEFSPSFASLKKENRDLPVFISAYLKSKSAFPITALPNAEIDLGSGKGEIDVIIPHTATAIECKCYTNNVAVAESTISGEAGKIRQQVERDVSLGFSRVLIVTNYNESDTQKLKVSLDDQLKPTQGLNEWKLLGPDLASFGKFLDDEFTKISAAINANLQKEFERRIAKEVKASQSRAGPPKPKKPKGK